jgi:predicted O-linked N-acetylglucosamine transferase (SPINDLY family)
MSSLSLQDHNALIASCEAEIVASPNDRTSYWNLSIAYLLNNMEEEAQLVWMSVLGNAEDDELENWRLELFDYLNQKSQDYKNQGMSDFYVLLIHYAHEILPEHLDGSLQWLANIISQDSIEGIDSLIDQVRSNLIQNQPDTLKSPLIVSTIEKLLSEIPLCPSLPDFIEAATPYIDTPFSLLKVILPASIKIAYSLRCPNVSVQLLNIYLSVDSLNLEIMGHLSSFYQNAGKYDEGIEVAQQRLQLTQDLSEMIFSSHLLLRGLFSAGGYWEQALEASQTHIKMLESLNSENTQNLEPVQVLRLFTSSYYLPYLEDGFRSRQRLNHVSQLCQSDVKRYTKDNAQYFKFRPLDETSSNSNKTKLKIGYLSDCTFKHSVGWLARWLIQHHDRGKFELYRYSISDRPYDDLQKWYESQFDHNCCLETEYGQDTQAFARKINEDGIDILIDLDSITLDLTCEILAMKPAPIQATWLGWDAIGMSAIDYFIADPYVLPDHAQEFYTEKIWRLPETYLAVDGFEVAVPTLTRDALNLPLEAVTFLTAQRGYKRHKDTATLQMRIISETPNAYLLIKGFADDQAIQNFFYEIADEVGVDRDRLRFLASDPSEAVHRANLRIADVVLDTYPYNGATTTMETLWMEVPIVTRVGEQFAARNSYTMMMNAGITEGIAWSAEEYIEWGIKLGTDAKLRQDVSWKLRQSKQTSPLWNGKQFARQMEDAYQQMWNNYVLSAGNSDDV